MIFHHCRTIIALIPVLITVIAQPKITSAQEKLAQEKSVQEKDANPYVRLFNPATMSQPARYSHIAEVQSGTRMVFISGQVAEDSQGNVIGKGDIRAQTTQVFMNIRLALQAVGATWANVVKMNAYLTDAANIGGFREIREQSLADGTPRAASTAVVVSKLFNEDWLVEVEVVAVIPDKKVHLKAK